ncbi:MAG: DUF3467 domain-containing protein [Thermoanaerobacteraceae bacterium]|nr:DUF3467 domain-containing protein [Thermoanaerobacteraceae bacterium]
MSKEPQVLNIDDMNIKIKPGTEACYSNFLRVSFTSTEFIFDFGFTGPKIDSSSGSETTITNRIIIPPEYLNQVIEVLQKQKDAYEKSLENE